MSCALSLPSIFHSFDFFVMEPALTSYFLSSLFFGSTLQEYVVLMSAARFLFLMGM